MADTKLTALTANTTPALTDILYIVDDPGGTPASQKVTLTSIKALFGLGDYILIRDEKTQSTHGGTFTTGAWRTRDLNTEVVDTGSHASVGSNQITLAAGTYRCHIVCPAAGVFNHRAKLYDVTNAADILLGSSSCAHADAGNFTVSESYIIGRFTLTGSTVLEVRHNCGVTNATLGFGVAAGFGTEYYTIAEFWKE
jgi:hypothetical protein